mmetsp:Transcript_36461/g.91746  ORF Transcript_36461/g.91746 Transcript_36461/m.91746 type:complete len:726 (-) Transcript_36461:146-2323(-)|eukprot:CAMPEP_0173450076 /NCGR_PEP_ID=MMETSP1357-20121228/43981_1 /TAXON_ID=77926 /ORGANISM="Hemiselmis rufescens, Strain PCC563" /LENGTH=725 /DNA_ID=CAMNT_0014416725 /DNA_START=269 /DNA_END=2446 /DNA_ORIENTATION=+
MQQSGQFCSIVKDDEDFNLDEELRIEEEIEDEKKTDEIAQNVMMIERESNFEHEQPTHAEVSLEHNSKRHKVNSGCASSIPAGPPSEDGTSAGALGADPGDAAAEAVKWLVRISPSRFQDDSERCKIYYALHDTLGKDIATKLFVEWCRAGGMFESTESVKRLLGSANPRPADGLKYLQKCANESPALVLLDNWTPPTPHTPRLEALFACIDAKHTKPLYLVRLVKLLNPGSKTALFDLLSKNGCQEDSLSACWDLDCDDCEEYTAALDSYVFDTLFSYSAVKQWFEQRCFKVMEFGGKCFAYVKHDRELKQCLQSDLSTMFSNLYFAEDPTDQASEEDEEPTGIVSKLFITKWLKDPKMRTFSRVVCNPSRTVPTPSDAFNIWSGLRAEGLAPVPDHEVALLVEPVIDHIRTVIASGDETGLNFVLAWLAQKVQFPEVKTCVAAILQGEHGVGKDIILDFIRKSVLGLRIAHQADNMAEIFEKHSTALCGRTFVQLDEAHGQDILPHINRLKSKITSSDLNVNPKNGHPFTLACYADFIFTTNNTNPIPIEPSDRRFVAFRCSSVRMGDKGYFDRLSAKLEDDRTARAFYQYLLAGDWGTYGCGGSMQNYRPTTACYTELQRLNIPLWARYLSKLCMGNSAGVDKGSFKGSVLVEGIKEWAQKNNYECRVTGTSLGGELKKFVEDSDKSGVSKSRNGGSSVYTFRWRLLQGYLKSKKLFDNEVF